MDNLSVEMSLLMNSYTFNTVCHVFKDNFSFIGKVSSVNICSPPRGPLCKKKSIYDIKYHSRCHLVAGLHLSTQLSMLRNSYVTITSFFVTFWFRWSVKCRLPTTWLSPNSVTSQSAIEKPLIACHCHVLVRRGSDHTSIEHHSDVV